MITSNEALERLIKEGRSGERERVRYEESCAQVPAGYLSAWDVCRIWGGSTESESPGDTAKRLVDTNDLPLMEIGIGRWVVTHSIKFGRETHG